MPARRFSNGIEQEIAAAYIQGASSSRLAAERGCDKSVICRILARRGIERRSASDAARRYAIDVSAFRKLTPEAEYWLGFLLTDGCVTANDSSAPVISIALAVVDAGHLEKFKAFLQSTHPVKIGATAARFQFRSREIAESLAVYGIVPKKTGRETCHPALHASRDFWRGVIDGDGCITHVDTFPTMALCGSRDLCAAFLSFVRMHTETAASPRKLRRANCWHVSVRSKCTRMLCEILYDGAVVALERKQAVATVLWDRQYKGWLNGGPSDLQTPGEFEGRGLVEFPDDIVW